MAGPFLIVVASNNRDKDNSGGGYGKAEDPGVCGEHAERFVAPEIGAGGGGGTETSGRGCGGGGFAGLPDATLRRRSGSSAGNAGGRQSPEGSGARAGWAGDCVAGVQRLFFGAAQECHRLDFASGDRGTTAGSLPREGGGIAERVARAGRRAQQCRSEEHTSE